MDLHGACFGKLAYPSKAKALEARNYTMRKQRKNYGHNGSKGGAKLTAYLCHRCHQWHLGSWSGPTDKFGGLWTHNRKKRRDRNVGR